MEFLKLNNGLQMPIIGLGLSVFPEDPKTVEDSVNLAIPIGYRHFDTATLYRTEYYLGKALQKCINAGEAKRDDIFIVTKLPQIAMRKELVEKFILNSLKDLQLDFIDLYLIHWPIGMEYRSETELMSYTGNGLECAFDNTTDLESIWKEMEKQVKAGRTKSIGLSNCNSKQIERIMKIAEIPPANLQIEVHAYLQQKELRKTCKKYNITITAYYPIGGLSRNSYPTNWQITKVPALLEDPVVNEIALKHKKSPAQVLLRFLTQLGIAVIPKSSNPTRLAENFNILNFKLDASDMSKMESLDKGESARGCLGMPGCENHPEYPF